MTVFVVSVEEVWDAYEPPYSYVLGVYSTYDGAKAGIQVICGGGAKDAEDWKRCDLFYSRAEIGEDFTRCYFTIQPMEVGD